MSTGKQKDIIKGIKKALVPKERWSYQEEVPMGDYFIDLVIRDNRYNRDTAVEVDENQHKSYDDDPKRDALLKKTYPRIVRCNPDSYKNGKNVIIEGCYSSTTHRRSEKKKYANGTTEYQKRITETASIVRSDFNGIKRICYDCQN